MGGEKYFAEGRLEDRPGYGNWAPASYQSFGPQDEADGGDRCEKTLLVAPGGELQQANTADCIVKLPSVRMVALVNFYLDTEGSTLNPMTDSSLAAYPNGTGIWGVHRTRNRASGRFAPVAVITGGSRTAPFGIPIQADLWGYQLELQSANEEAFFQLTVAAGNDPPAGVNWKVNVTYRSTVPLTGAEWRAFTAKAGIIAGGPKVMK